MEYRAKELTNKVYESIREHWPVHATGVCRSLGMEINSSNISKVKYHIEILKRQSKVRTKKLDRALVAWPVEIEKLRVMQELIKD